MMRKWKISIIAALVFVMAFAGTAAAADGKIHVFLDDKELNFSVDPVIIKGTTFVELRTLFTVLGYSFKYEHPAKKIHASLNGMPIVLQIGSSTATVEGSEYDIKAAPFIKNGRTMIPLRFLSELTGMKVAWNKSAQTITLTWKSMADQILAELRTFFVIQSENALNGELEKLIDSIDSKSPIYEDGKKAFEAQLKVAKVENTYIITKLLSYDKTSAVVEVRQTAKKVSGGEFKNFEAFSEIQFTKGEDGAWRIYSIDTTEFNYIED